MVFTIGETANKTGISEYTLRFYEKKGLMPFVKRTSSGRRYFSEDDIDFLGLITCLKNTGMPLAEIKDFVDMTMQGDETLEKRLTIFRTQRAAVKQQIAAAQRRLEKLDFKVRYFEAACEAGTEAAVEGDCDVPNSPITINDALRVK
ncbi:MAG: MerR family transcriptional regulator [Lactobacillus sp.]|jgi:DNA-binding transcriptional MerR regulator|nr:MerR family transcriptional regulator [Lactobacillus sp.]